MNKLKKIISHFPLQRASGISCALLKIIFIMLFGFGSKMGVNFFGLVKESLTLVRYIAIKSAGRWFYQLSEVPVTTKLILFQKAYLFE